MTASIFIDALGTDGAVMRPLSEAVKDAGGEPLADVTGTAERAARAGNLVFVASRCREQLAPLTGISGVVPVLAGAPGNPLSDPAMVHVNDIAALAPLTRDSAIDCLALVRFRPSDVRAEQQTAIEAHCRAIAAAGGVMIYGAGNIGRQAVDAARLAGLTVSAVLDADSRRHGTVFEGSEIRGPESVIPGVSIVVPALGRAIAAVSANLRALGARDIMSLSQLYALSRRPGEPETDYLDDLYANRWRYLSLYCLAADDRSRAVLDAVIRHRLTLATEPCAEVCERGHPQWFEPAFLSRRPNDVFVDAGAHDGDTAEGYIKFRGDGFVRVHAFEIDPDLVEAGRRRVGDDARVIFHNLGLSDGSGEVFYRRTGGTDGSISSAAGHGARVSLGRIDDYVLEPATYIKLDVEGMEALVLEGARHQIENNRPMLGVAAYHKAHDLWDLSRRIVDFNAEYRLYLRHYTDVAYETVVYAVPAGHQPANTP